MRFRASKTQYFRIQCERGHWYGLYCQEISGNKKRSTVLRAARAGCTLSPEHASHAGARLNDYYSSVHYRT
jgi:hypothetical protein